ncbi:MAG: hypothetical protein J5856_05550 [Lachnospiraceae bacterium]|nr:hypothetical protein [Lachnospiraceae bacterium]
MERPTPPWINQIPEGAFVSYDPTYPTGKYFDRFERDEAAGLKYYFFDPTKHGYPKKKDYPLLIFLHGTSNALVGDLCINYTGAEMYASDEYQKDLGGAYILIPVANEYRDENENVVGFWNDEYIEPVSELIDDFLSKHTLGVGVRFLLGNSSGARFTFTMAKYHPEKFDVLIPVGAFEIPADGILDIFEDLGITLFYAYSKHDEFMSFERVVLPRLEKISSMKNSFVFTPDWTYNGDKGIASINFGIEMGQHCLMNEIQMNIKFDDGTPMDESLPGGLTSWMAEEIARRGKKRRR